MGSTILNELELMMGHCDALFVHNARSELVCSNEWQRRPAPAFWLGLTRKGRLWRFREDVPAAARRRIRRLIEQESNAAAPLPRHHGSYLALAPAEDGVAGLTCVLRAVRRVPDHPVDRVRPENAGLLRDGGLAPWIPDVPHQQPMFASVVDGRAVAVCASVRITPVAHEAGVETLQAYRCRGHASAVVAAWAQALLTAGVLPLYSTTWDNAASRRVATGLGGAAFGWDYPCQ